MNRKSRKSRKIKKIALVLGLAVAALSVSVPTALAEGRLAGSQQPDGVAYFKANEMATLSQSVSPLSTYPDASQRPAAAGTNEPGWYKALVIRGEGLSKLYGSQTGNLGTYRDAGQRAVPQPQSPNVTPTSSDDDIQWPQIGVGLAVALFLVLGIGLAVRTNRMRPAH
jgi:hypothetical protein